jgi:hypothetical protein
MTPLGPVWQGSTGGSTSGSGRSPAKRCKSLRLRVWSRHRSHSRLSKERRSQQNEALRGSALSSPKLPPEPPTPIATNRAVPDPRPRPRRQIGVLPWIHFVGCRSMLEWRRRVPIRCDCLLKCRARRGWWRGSPTGRKQGSCARLRSPPWISAVGCRRGRASIAAASPNLRGFGGAPVLLSAGRDEENRETRATRGRDTRGKRIKK